VAHLVRPTAGPIRFIQWLCSCSTALALVVVAFEAAAAPKDNAALKLDRDAMDSDYLATNWSGAESKLQKALRTCGGGRGCSAKVRGRLQLHLGIILVNAGKTPEAVAAFGEALRLNPAVSPESDFANPEVVKVFDEAKRRKAGAAPPSPPPAPTGPAEVETPPPADVTHAPVTEQVVGAPVPIYAEGDAAVARMVLYYRGGGGGDFVKVEMRRAGKGFRAVVPCRATSAAGAVSYYIITLDAKGEPAGGAGSRADPFQVAIKTRIDGEPPHFPNEKPLAACPPGAMCPPGVDEAGCDRAAGAVATGGVGARCSEASACNPGLACVEGACRERGDAAAEGAYRKNWVSMTASLDFAFVPTRDVCSLANQKERGAYACFLESGDDPAYRGQPQPGDGGALSGFVRPGTARFLLGYDRALSANVLLGVRAGYAIGGAPEKGYYTPAFLPFHGEVRATYVFGDAPLARRGLHPYVYAGGGLGEVQAKVPNVETTSDCEYGGRPACPVEGGQAPIIKVVAYRRLGRFFGGAGLGALWLIGPGTGLFADLKVSGFGPTLGVAVAPSVGVTQGF
jgi:hypothetical protein